MRSIHPTVVALVSLTFIYSSASAQQTKVEVQKEEVKKEEAKKAEPAKAASAPSAVEPAPRSVEGYWMKRHEKFLHKIKQGDIGLLFIGDSITQGWEGGGKDVWKRSYEPRKAVNLGIGGDRTQHVLWRLDHGEVDGISPKVAVVMIGTNNIGGNTPEQIAEGVKAIVAKLKSKLPTTKVLLLAVFPRDSKPDGKNRLKVKAVNENLKSLADGNSVRYLDIGERFLEPDGTIKREIMPDFLHLSPRGYKIWADAIEPTLWDMLNSD